MNKIYKITAITIAMIVSLVLSPKIDLNADTIDDIVNKSKENKTLLEELEKEPIGCSPLSNPQECKNILEKLKADEEVYIELVILVVRGVHVYVSSVPGPKTIEVDRYGAVVIYGHATIQEIRAFLGLK